MSADAKTDGIDKRRDPRLSITHQFSISHQSLGEIECDTRDLSLSGAFVLGDFSSINIGTTIAVSFIIASKRPGSNKALQYSFNAIVVRVDETGAGLNFAGLDAATDAAIYGLMHQ